MKNYQIVATVLAFAFTLPAAQVSKSCLQEIVNVSTKSNFDLENFTKSLITSVAKVKAEEKAQAKLKSSRFGSFANAGAGNDGKTTDVGLTVGCVKQLPENPTQIKEVLKSAGLEIKNAGLEVGKKALEEKVYGNSDEYESANERTEEKPKRSPLIYNPSFERVLLNIAAKNDSIILLDSIIDVTVQNFEPIAPKGEFEKTEDYNKRMSSRNAALSNAVSPLQERKRYLIAEVQTILNSQDDNVPEWQGILIADTNSNGYELRKQELATRKSQNYKFMEYLKQNKNFNASNFELKFNLYASRLDRAIEVLDDYNLRKETRIIRDTTTTVEYKLGSYNPDLEYFEVEINDLNGKAPFKYKGKINVPIDIAPSIKENPNFTTMVSYYNYPFTGIFPSVIKIETYQRGANEPFGLGGRFLDISINSPQYSVYKTHLDSIKTGKIKEGKGLDEEYALYGTFQQKSAPTIKDVFQSEEEEEPVFNYQSQENYGSEKNEDSEKVQFFFVGGAVGFFVALIIAAIALQ